MRNYEQTRHIRRRRSSAVLHTATVFPAKSLVIKLVSIEIWLIYHSNMSSIIESFLNTAGE